MQTLIPHFLANAMQPSPLRRSDTPLINVEPDAADNWAESVLKEAEASSSSDKQESVWSVKDAVQLFDRR